MTPEVPAGRVPNRGRVLREERAGACLVGSAEVVVFRLVSLERSGEELVDGNGGQARTAKLPGVKGGEVERIERDDCDQEIFGGLAEELHVSLRTPGIS